ncbi:MAG: MotA/TolQ/ExbB proton channel family protein [Phycisphaerae bacterium]
MVRIACFAAVATLLMVVLATVPVHAQADASAVAGDTANRFDFFVGSGGWITILLIALSVVTISLAIEHCFSIRRASIAPHDAHVKMKALIDERQYLDAIRFTAEDPSMMCYVVNAGLAEAQNGYIAMERAVEESIEERAAKLHRKIEYLHVLGNVAPMIGLFGTVYGMIELFLAIKVHGQLPPAAEVADKIAIALVTTFWGLAVAIPALSIFAVFRNRIDVLTAECAIAAEKLLSVFKPSVVRKGGESESDAA